MESAIFPVSFKFKTNSIESENIRKALMRMNGFPNGIPLNEEVPNWLKSIHGNSNHGNIDYFIQAKLEVRQDGSFRLRDVLVTQEWQGYNKYRLSK